MRQQYYVVRTFHNLLPFTKENKAESHSPQGIHVFRQHFNIIYVYIKVAIKHFYIAYVTLGEQEIAIHFYKAGAETPHSFLIDVMQV